MRRPYRVIRRCFVRGAPLRSIIAEGRRAGKEKDRRRKAEKASGSGTASPVTGYCRIRIYAKPDVPLPLLTGAGPGGMPLDWLP